MTVRASGQVLRRVTEICSSLLDGAEPAPTESLLDRGVDSLLAAKIVALLDIEWGVDLAEYFFTAPTIAGLAGEIEAQTAGR